MRSYRTATLQVVTGSACCAAGMAVLLGYEHGRIGLGGVALDTELGHLLPGPLGRAAGQHHRRRGRERAARPDRRAHHRRRARVAACGRLSGGRHPPGPRGGSGTAQPPALPARHARGPDGCDDRGALRSRCRQRTEGRAGRPLPDRSHPDLLPDRHADADADELATQRRNPVCGQHVRADRARVRHTRPARRVAWR